MTYREALDWLYSTQLFGIKLGLDDPTRLLRQFLAFPRHGVKVIQIAGTNGKGSTAAFADSLARACGYRTGLFTSPHLVDYAERIRVSGVNIDHDRCAELVTELRTVAESLDTHPTFFELTLALAMRHFYESRCEVIVLEVGMGGRLDATTAVPTDASIITPIGLDHTKWLGNSLDKVALEKAGIMREGVPCFCAAQAPDAERVLREHANQTRSPLEFVTTPAQGYPIGLRGAHQRENAALALAALHSIGAPLGYDCVVTGLGDARHSGRFDIHEAASLSRAADLILDAAHNPHAAQSLAATWRDTYRDAKANLIFGAVADKDVSAILDILAPIVGSLHLVPVNSARGVPTDDLMNLVDARSDLPSSIVHDTLDDALQATAADPSPTLITGSLFLIGEAIASLDGASHRPSAQ